MKNIIKQLIKESIGKENQIERIKNITLPSTIEGRFLNKQQAQELQKEIEANYTDNILQHFNKEKNDIRMHMFNYDQPIAEKNLNGINLRITTGLIRNKKITYLLYADGKIIGEFYSVGDIKRLVKYIEDRLIKKELNESDPKVGTGKKPNNSSRRLYTDENPNDTVSVKFKTKEDIIDTLNKESFKSKSHKRQSQIINLIHQRVRAAYQNAKDPDTKKRLKRALDYIIIRKEKSKEKTIRLQKESVENNIVTCDNCNWQWNLKDGGDDPYTCHKCGHDNNPNILNEDLQSNVIFLPYSNDYNEDLEDYNIDEYDVEPQALNIAKQNNLNILRDKNLKGFLFDTSNNKIVGASWTSDDNNSFSFDIAIDKQYQGLKLSHLLIKNAIDEYNTQSDYGNINLPMKVDVINPMLANILKTKYNFRAVKRISNDRVIMALKKNLKEEENILNEKCWKGYTQKGMKTMFGKRYPNCVKKLKEQEDYKGEHSAPSKDQGYSSMNDLYNAYGDDIYTNNAVRYYGDGYPYDNLAIEIMQSAKNKPNKLIKIYRAIPDFNYEVKEKIKELLKINQYYDKFNFFPLNNNIIETLQNKYPIENYSYEKQTQLILQDIFKQINNLKNQLKNNKITINDGDWVTTTLQYAKSHGQAHLNNKYKVISKVVPASTLYTDGNSIHEFGYNP